MTSSTSALNMRTSPVPLSRLVRVEIRKMVDTRAGFWLVMSIAIISAVITVAALLFTPERELNLGAFFALMNIPLGVLLPVLAILLVTSEWSQRTAMVTYSLEPRRLRVVLAKFLTAVIAALAASLVALAFAAIGNLLTNMLYSQADGSWSMSVAGMSNSFLLQLIVLIEGFGFAMLLMNSAAAIVLFFAVPMVWNIVTSVVPWLRDNIQQWANLDIAQAPLQSGYWASSDEWLRLLTAVIIWVGVPSVVGIIRLLKTEVK